MGKKSSQKKQQRRAPQPVSSPAQAPARKAMELASLTQEGVVARQEAPQKPASFGEQSAEFIRADIRRITLLLILVAVLLGAAAIWNAKSPVLSNAGKRIASFMRLQH